MEKIVCGGCVPKVSLLFFVKQPGIDDREQGFGVLDGVVSEFGKGMGNPLENWRHVLPGCAQRVPQVIGERFEQGRVGTGMMRGLHPEQVNGAPQEVKIPLLRPCAAAYGATARRIIAERRAQGMATD